MLDAVAVAGGTHSFAITSIRIAIPRVIIINEIGVNANGIRMTCLIEVFARVCVVRATDHFDSIIKYSPTIGGANDACILYILYINNWNSHGIQNLSFQWIYGIVTENYFVAKLIEDKRCAPLVSIRDHVYRMLCIASNACRKFIILRQKQFSTPIFSFFLLCSILCCTTNDWYTIQYTHMLLIIHSTPFLSSRLWLFFLFKLLSFDFKLDVYTCNAATESIGAWHCIPNAVLWLDCYL